MLNSIKATLENLNRALQQKGIKEKVVKIEIAHGYVKYIFDSREQINTKEYNYLHVDTKKKYDALKEFGYVE